MLHIWYWDWSTLSSNESTPSSNESTPSSNESTPSSIEQIERERELNENVTKRKFCNISSSFELKNH